jgi:hypothetical protein
VLAREPELPPRARSKVDAVPAVEARDTYLRDAGPGVGIAGQQQ